MPNNDFFKNGDLIYKIIEGIVFYEKYYNKINIENSTSSISEFLIELYKIPISKNNIEQYRQSQINIFTKNINNIKNYFNFFSIKHKKIFWNSANY